MKRILIGVLAASSLAAAMPASAAAWQSINSRQNQIFGNIEQGIRNGALTRAEAYRLKSDFYRITRLESQYRHTGNGLSAWERRDLDRRLDALKMRVRIQRHDYQRRH